MAKKGKIAPISKRFKAFWIDIFIIAIPLLYFTTYVVLDGKDDFQHNRFAISTVWLIYMFFLCFLQCKTAQSPGYRVENIYLIDAETGKKANFLKCIFRFILFVVFTPFALLVCFFRKDSLNLHDLFSKTIPLAPIKD